MKEKLKKCPACGSFFICSGDDDCWCEHFKIHKKDYVRIMEQYTDCLCQKCLKEYAEPE